MRFSVCAILGTGLALGWAAPASANDFEQAWGRFYDGYGPGSAVGKADLAFATIASCSGSTVWESIPLRN